MGVQLSAFVQYRMGCAQSPTQKLEPVAAQSGRANSSTFHENHFMTRFWTCVGPVEGLRALRLDKAENKKKFKIWYEDASPGAPLEELCNAYLRFSRLPTGPIL